MAATTAMDSAAAPRARVGARSDHDLVAAVRAGDDSAFEQLYERYNRRVAYYVYGMVHDYGRAEDISQEVFISALRRMRQTERPIAFKPWIYEIAKNACIDQYRRSQRTKEVSYEAEDAQGAAADLRRLAQAGATPEHVVEQKMSLDNLCGAFSGLSETHHQILVMRELEGLSYTEIGQRMDMSRAAVESTLFRARRRLAEEYEELVTGERCRRVQAIVAGALEGELGARDHRRLAAHISHCQACRRHAFAAGVDLGADSPKIRSKMGVLLPFPLLLRRRAPLGPDGPGSAHGSLLSQWGAQITSTVDPAALSWMRAAAAAVTVAVAGIGAGAQEGHIANVLMNRPSGSAARVAQTIPLGAKTARRHSVRHVVVSARHGGSVAVGGAHAATGHHGHMRPSAPRPASSSAIPAVTASAKNLVPKVTVRNPVQNPVNLEGVKKTPVKQTVTRATQVVKTQAEQATEQGQRVIDHIVDVLQGP